MRTQSIFVRTGARAVARDAISLAPSYVVPGIASLASVPILFALLGASGYGSWALMFAIAQGVPRIVASWLEGIIVRYGHLGESPLPIGPASLAAALSAVVGAVLVLALVPRASVTAAVATAALTGSVALYLLASASLQSRLRFGAISRMAATRVIASMSLAIGAAAAVGTPEASVVGAAVGFCAGAVPVLVRSPSRPGEWAGTVTMEASDSVPTVGVAAFSAASSLFLLSVVDRFILAGQAPLASVGVYAASYTSIDLAFRFMPTIVLIPVRARLFRSWDTGDREGRLAELTGVATLLLWSMTALALAAVLVSASGGPLPVDEPIVATISAAMVASGVATALSIGYWTEGRHIRLASLVSVAAAAAVLASLVLIPALGMVGAALASLAGYLSLLALYVMGSTSARVIVKPPHRWIWVSATMALALIVAGTFAGHPIVAFLLAALILGCGAPFAFRLARTTVGAR